MCHRGSYMTRDGTFTVHGDGTVSGGRGLVGPMWCAAGRVAGRAGAGRACTTATRSRAESSELFRDAPFPASPVLVRQGQLDTAAREGPGHACDRSISGAASPQVAGGCVPVAL